MPVPPSTRITSRQHHVVRRFRRAARRNDANVVLDIVLLEGEHLISDALDASVPIEIVLTDERHGALRARAKAAGATVLVATASVLEAASPVRTPSGIVALARWQPAAIDDVLQRVARESGLGLGMCGVQDPGNCGSVIRAADGLGATGVLALDETADPGGWKTMRGSMGSVFRIPVAAGETAHALKAAKLRGLQIVATVAAGGQPIDAVDLRSPSLLLLGSEGSGLADAIVKEADVRVTIPMRSGANSLNVAAAAAVLLYEARRQRALVR